MVPQEVVRFTATAGELLEDGPPLASSSTAVARRRAHDAFLMFTNSLL